MQKGANSMPLTMAGAGNEIVVDAINGKDETRRFLENLGFVKGTKISVITEISGNLIVNVRDTRVAVSRAMANRIMVNQAQ